MLTVSRKKVQEVYTEIINDIRDFNGENPEMVGTTDPILRERAEGMKALLHRLFGSKCLPDEVVVAENATTTEPKSVEPKFKVGEKVMYKGVLRVIDSIDALTHRYHLSNGNYYAEWVDESDLEPYTEPNPIGKEVNFPTKNEFRNLSQNIADCDKEFDNILKDSFSKERRLNIATQILSGIVASDKPYRHPVKRAIELTDALLAEFDKTKENGN